MPSLPSGETFNLSVDVVTAAGGTVTLVASVASGNAESTPGDNTSFETTTVTPAGRSLVVTNTSDSGAGSLRQAILESNADSGDVDTITFNIPGAGVHTITPVGHLPFILEPVVIDGTVATGYDGSPVIELRGSAGFWGLTVDQKTGSAIRGLSISGFDFGIVLFAGGNAIEQNVLSGNSGAGLLIRSNGNVVRGNRIGTNAAGTAAAPNANGIAIGGTLNTIGGNTAAARNIVSGNTQAGIQFFFDNAEPGITGSSNTVHGNYIGTTADGLSRLANGTGVITFGAANTIGGPNAGEGNLVAGNTGNGIDLSSPNNLVQGNVVGLNAAAAPLSNAIGVRVAGSGNRVQFNTIQSNTSDGVRVASGAGSRILSNRISANSFLGINLAPGGVTANDAGDADTGANNLQNFPVLSAVAGGVQGTLNSAADATFTIEYFANTACDAPSGFGEGLTPLGSASVTTNASGTATLPFFAAPAGQVVTATATSSNGDTSEFSACATVPLGPATFTVTNTNDSGAGSLRQAILDANARVEYDGHDLRSTSRVRRRSRLHRSRRCRRSATRSFSTAARSRDIVDTPIIELNGAAAGAGTSGSEDRGGKRRPRPRHQPVRRRRHLALRVRWRQRHRRQPHRHQRRGGLRRSQRQQRHQRQFGGQPGRRSCFERRQSDFGQPGRASSCTPAPRPQ